MNLQLTEAMTLPAMLKTLQEMLPNYTHELKKNPVLRFEYIQVKKTGWVGLWIRPVPAKNKVQLIKAIPSTLNRALLGGLIALLIVAGAQNKLRKEVADVLKSKFNTKEI